MTASLTSEPTLSQEQTEKKYILALDQGTTSSRCILFDREQNIMSLAQKEFPQIYPKAGWVEHNPTDIYVTQYGVLIEALTKMNVAPSEIAGIGITNQRETTIVWDKETGLPVYNGIVWQCRRTAQLCEDVYKRQLLPRGYQNVSAGADRRPSPPKPFPYSFLKDPFPPAAGKSSCAARCTCLFPMRSIQILPFQFLLIFYIRIIK